MNRDENITRIRERTEPWDIVVIGGGATGVGCALDAASRGYDVLLLEQHDFGKGTSSRSTKLIHGGVRYLRQANISLVREALKERGILLRNAPHVVHTQEFIVPCYGWLEKAFYGLGLKIYDLLAGRYSIGKSRILSPEETLERLPPLRTQGLVGGVLYHDGQFDDTRLLIDMAQTASSNSACLVNYARARSFIRDAEKIAGVEFEDTETGVLHTVAANAVINATGALCDAVRQLSDSSAKPVVTFAQGSHIVLDRSFLPSNAAVMIPKTSDGRVLFCIPWHEHVLVGTTDTPVDSASLEPEALDAEIEFILETAGEYLTTKPTRADIRSAFAGIRPLVSRSDVSNTASLSRSHEMFVDASGLITITGGKWTTYRRMAEEAVNKAASTAGLRPVECVTETLTITPHVAEPGEQLHPGFPYTVTNVVEAVRNEMARTVEDVLARRTRALFLNARVAIEIAPRVAKIMAVELGKDEDWIANQLTDFGDLAERYFARPT
ncbi:MAG: glycerol-3-phosphate dehydrogenase/oxidase [Acidobacteria bacterium]|nr:glycerol-3-phosphate dehydrogenase/oxidase [Acidobacteriota bacterium]